MAVRISSRGQLEDTIVQGGMLDVMNALNQAVNQNQRFALLTDLNDQPVILEITNITRGRMVGEEEIFMRSSG